MAYTYNEPLVGYEYVRDCAALVHQAGMLNVLVTNGTIAEDWWRKLLPLIDAVNIDLKGFTASTKEYFALLISGEHFAGYWSAVGRVMGIIAKVLIIALPCVLLLVITATGGQTEDQQ